MQCYFNRSASMQQLDLKRNAPEKLVGRRHILIYIKSTHMLTYRKIMLEI